MHVTRVELENIKVYDRAEYDFERGTTAIVGANGAGKTTILEAIAWTLFDTLEYSKDDFLRRGAKKGWVRVTFESDLDGRRYTIYRDTGQGYYVYDPALGVPIGGGGRYDDLLGRFGRSLPAVGFALTIDRLHIALTGEEKVAQQS